MGVGTTVCCRCLNVNDLNLDRASAYKGACACECTLSWQSDREFPRGDASVRFIDENVYL